jgi:hypothetical protein
MDVFKEKVALFFFYFKSIFGYFHNIVTGGEGIPFSEKSFSG